MSQSVSHWVSVVIRVTNVVTQRHGSRLSVTCHDQVVSADNLIPGGLVTHFIFPGMHRGVCDLPGGGRDLPRHRPIQPGENPSTVQ